MILKKHINQGRLILALCDTNLIGKTFEDKTGYLNLKSNFYKGDETSEEVIVDLFKQVYIVNAVGKNSVNLLEKENMVSKNQIKYIQEIPHAQVVVDERK